MFEIVPEPEFSAWFESLPEADAEQVASALDVIANCGTVLRPARVSRLMLWYDGMPNARVSGKPPKTGNLTGVAWVEWLELREQFGAAGIPWVPTLTHALHEAVDDIHELLSWRADVMRVFESESFAARLGRLPPDLAAQVLDEITRLKNRLRAGRIETMLRLASAESVKRIRDLRDEIREPFVRVLALVGLEPRSIERSDAGLRELTITTTTPQLRVLFGIDPVRRRIVAIIGDALTRNYYGDSVRLAESRWASYCTEQETAHTP